MGKQLSGAVKRKKYGYSKIQPSGAANRRKYGYSPPSSSKHNPRYWAGKHDFLFVDGEAIDGRYVLLACSDKSTVENRQGLSTNDCLAFLTSRPTHTLWGFAFDYDVNQILCDLTPSALQRLLVSNKTYWGDFAIEHIPGKMFRVWTMKGEVGIDNGPNERKRSDRYVTIWDAFSYIHTSFARWMADWKLGSTADLAFIRKMKDRRPTFTLRQLAEIRRYCLTELRLGEEGIHALLDRVETIGYRPNAWHSPGSIAAAAMRRHGVKDYIGDPPAAVQRIADAAYFGGRFEARMLGFFKGPLWHYDINSAYPSALVQLPCLDCGTWKRRRPGKPADMDQPHALLHVSWRPRSQVRKLADRQPWGPFPVRVEAGSLRYPLIGEGWYWSFEVEAARAFAHVKVLHTVQFEQGCEHTPFAYLADLYQRRQTMKAAHDEAEYVLKLILNSTYGKLAQHIRRDPDRPPPFRSPVWAGMITARCRAQLLGAMALDPEAIIQTATDGLTSTRELALPVSEELGGWSVKQVHRLLLMSSGVYFWQDTEDKPFQRSRGFHPSTMTQETCYQAWKGQALYIDFPNRRFVGYRSAMHRGKLDLWRTWEDYRTRLGLTLEPRRETISRSQGRVLSAPPVRAQTAFMDVVDPALGWEDGDWEIEQPDGMEGDTL